MRAERQPTWEMFFIYKKEKIRNPVVNQATDFSLFACGVFYLFCKRCCSSGSDWMRCNSSATICRTSARMRL